VSKDREHLNLARVRRIKDSLAAGGCNCLCSDASFVELSLESRPHTQKVRLCRRHAAHVLMQLEAIFKGRCGAEYGVPDKGLHIKCTKPVGHPGGDHCAELEVYWDVSDTPALACATCHRTHWGGTAVKMTMLSGKPRCGSCAAAFREGAALPGTPA
jgi:hypothetical protein